MTASPTNLRTDRMLLVAGTAEILRAHLVGGEALGACLDAVVDAVPEEVTPERVREFLETLEVTAEPAGWFLWYLVGLDEPRRLIGVGRYKGPPGSLGTVEVDCAVLPELRRRGYATEATRALVESAFGDPRVRAVMAESRPGSAAFIGLLEKCGFACVGAGSTKGTLRYAYLRHWRQDPSPSSN